jgi:transposase-like protein
MAAQRPLDRYAAEVPEDFLREMLELLVNGLMAAEVSTLIGAEPHERSPERTTWRNGTRPRQWDTRVGTLELAIPKLREGSYFPSFLDPRRRSCVFRAKRPGIPGHAVRRDGVQLG